MGRPLFVFRAALKVRRPVGANGKPEKSLGEYQRRKKIWGSLSAGKKSERPRKISPTDSKKNTSLSANTDRFYKKIQAGAPTGNSTDSFKKIKSERLEKVFAETTVSLVALFVRWLRESIRRNDWELRVLFVP